VTVQAESVPRSTVDVFTDHVADGPYEAYREIRDAGPVVYLERLDAYAISRYDDVRAVLKNWRTFKSPGGTAFNPLFNQAAEGTILHSEPPEHTRLRASMVEHLRLSSIIELSDWMNERAEALVAPLVERGSADVAAELAHPFPGQIVGELIGLRPDMTEQFVIGSEAVFAGMGPLNERGQTAMQVIGEVLTTISQMKKEDLVPGSLGYAIFEAAERGDVPPENTVKLLWNYVGPAFDTTIQGINNMVWLLASHPDAFLRLREDPSLISAACFEALRVEPPVQVWGRLCAADTEVSGYMIPAGARAAVLLGAANRDERHYPDPDRFDVDRDPKDLLTFGFGVHSCPGNGLARLEIESVMRALARLAGRIEVREAERFTNNTVRGFRRLVVELSAA
jgi:cytochrome P450